MDNEKFTKGLFTSNGLGISHRQRQWHLENETINSFSWTTIYANKKAIALIIAGPEREEELKANTALMEQSKNMYKMLKRFSKYFDEMFEVDVCNEINELLSKARGEI